MEDILLSNASRTDQQCTVLASSDADSNYLPSEICQVARLALWVSRWSGVRASRSFMSSDTAVIGLLLTIISARHITVVKLSSSSDCSLSNEFRIFRTDRICRFHAPPMWDATGGLYFHRISCWIRDFDSFFLIPFLHGFLQFTIASFEIRRIIGCQF